MKNNTSSKSGLFLMELIMAILFFSLSSAICIRLFVQSHITSKKSVELNHAVEWCQNVAETFYGCDGNETEMMKLFPNSQKSVASSSGFYLTYDRAFQPVLPVLEKSSLPPSDYPYLVLVEIYEDRDMKLCDISTYLYSPGETRENIYELHICLPIKKEASYE